MTYTEAIDLARAGEERGYGFLYEKTYKSKYYLALQYMKNEEEAEDVLQEAYMKAFAKIDTLENPEAFPGWLGMIVANTAKNMLGKKRPVLFADLAVDEEGEQFEYQIEDDDLEVQPELSYTRQETKERLWQLQRLPKRPPKEYQVKLQKQLKVRQKQKVRWERPERRGFSIQRPERQRRLSLESV